MKRKRLLTSMIAILVILLVILLVLLRKQEGEMNKDITFPYLLEEEQLEITSLSTATMPNPDAGGIMGEDIASLEITNKTGQYLARAEVEVELEDGTIFTFAVNDLPMDGTVQAFDLNNTVYDDKVNCNGIKVNDLQLKKDDQLMSGEISYVVNGTEILLTNVSKEDIENLTVTCLCNMDGYYFGGTSYSYEVGKISAGENILLDAVDCYLGEAEIVSITAENK